MSYKTVTKQIDLREVEPTDGNPQKLSDEKHRLLVENFKKHGWTIERSTIWEYEPGKYRCVSGWHRIQAALEALIFHKDLNVIIDPEYTEKQARLDLLSANNIHGDPDKQKESEFIIDIADEFDLSIEEMTIDVGLSEEDLANLVGDYIGEGEEKPAKDNDIENDVDRNMIVIEFETEREMRELYNNLTNEGYKCKIIA